MSTLRSMLPKSASLISTSFLPPMVLGLPLESEVLLPRSYSLRLLHARLLLDLEQDPLG